MKPAELTGEQKEFILRHKKDWGSRRIARELGISRQLVENELSHTGGRPPALSRIFTAKQGLRLSFLIVFCLTFLVYSNTLGHKFVWDDTQFIIRDKTLEDPGNLPKTIVKPLGFFGRERGAGETLKGSLWRPVVTASFFADTFFWGKAKPWGYHLTNVLTHCLTAFLFLIFLRRIVGPTLLATLGTLFFALHPVQSEAIASVNGRSTPISGLFVLLAFLVYPGRIGLTCAALLLAVYSKETAVPFFGAVLAYDLFVNRKKMLSASLWLKNYVPILLATGAYFVTRFLVLGGLGSVSTGDVSSGYFTWFNRLKAQPLYFAEYLKMIFAPMDLHMWRSLYFPKSLLEPAYLFPLLLFAGLITAGWVAYRTDKKAFFGLAWFLVFLIPVLNLFVILQKPVMEHWLYLPLMGFTLFLIVGLQRLLLVRPRAGLCALAVLVLMVAGSGAVTYHQNKIWKDEVTLFEYITRFETKDASLYFNLGTAYAEAGSADKAEKAFSRALELDPQYKDARFNLDLLHAKETHAKLSGVAGSVGPVGSVGSAGPVANTEHGTGSKSEILENLYDCLDQLDPDFDRIPDLKQGPVGGKPIYSYLGKAVDRLDQEQLGSLATACDSQVAQVRYEEEETRKNSAASR